MCNGFVGLSSQRKENIMRLRTSTLGLALLTSAAVLPSNAFAVEPDVDSPAMAADRAKATTEADCEKAGGAWNLQTGKCAEESAKMGKEEGTHEGANLGATPENDMQKIDQPERRNPTTSN